MEGSSISSHTTASFAETRRQLVHNLAHGKRLKKNIFKETNIPLVDQLKSELGLGEAWRNADQCRGTMVNRGTSYHLIGTRSHIIDSIEREQRLSVQESLEGTLCAEESDTEQSEEEESLLSSPELMSLCDSSSTSTSLASDTSSSHVSHDDRASVEDSHIRVPSVRSPSLLASSIVNITMSSNGQIALDPTSRHAFLVRKIHLIGDEGSAVSAPTDLKGLGLVKGLPYSLVNPHTGTQFDMQTFGGRGLVTFGNPTLCMAAIEQTMKQSIETIVQQKDYLWTVSEISKSTTVLDSFVAPWMQLKAKEIVVVDDATREPSVLALSMAIPKSKHPEDKRVVGTMHDPITGEMYETLVNGMIYRPRTGDCYPLPHWAEARHAEGNTAPPRFVVPREVRDTEAYLNQQGTQPNEMDSTASEVLMSYRHLTAENQSREIEIRSRDSFVIMPQTLLVLEQQGLTAYVANPIHCTTSAQIYTEQDMNRAVEIAFGRNSGCP